MKVLLDWNLNGTAIRVYKVNGTNNGAHTFNLNDWETGNGGTWENWFIDNGSLNETSSTPIDCSVVSVKEEDQLNAVAKIYPNPFQAIFHIESESEILELTMIDVNGKLLMWQSDIQSHAISLDKASLPTGVYFLKLRTTAGLFYYKLLKK